MDVKRPLKALLWFLAIFLSACGPETRDERSANGVESISPRATAVQESPISEILEFTAPKLGGGQVEGSEFQGSDLAIWFWAPW